MRTLAFSGAEVTVCVALTACTLTYTGHQTIDMYSSPDQKAALVSAISESQLIMDSHANDWIRFKGLAEIWREMCGIRSSTTEIVALMPYQKIIGMGEKAIPFILADLRANRDDPDNWFAALYLLTDANPVREEDRGNFSAMATAWLEWGLREGYSRDVAAG